MIMKAVISRSLTPLFRAKLKPLFSLTDKGVLKIPIWASDKMEHILKVKAKFVNNMQELVKNALYIININFEFYSMDETNLKGHYAKIAKAVPSTPPPGIEVEILDDAS